MTVIIGDKVSSIYSASDDATLSMQPASGEEWTIHNLSWGGAMELYFTNGTTSILVGSSFSAGGRFNNYLNCTHTNYYQLKNVSGTTVGLGYDGVVTKIA